jgi:phage/plasmid-associated DNA primase
VLLTFDRRFDESINAEAPERLSAELASEVPGILAWAFEGAHRAAQRGAYTPVESSTTAITEWREEGDQVSGWLATWDVGHREFATGIFADEAYRNYQQWAIDNGHRALSSASFGKRLKQIAPSRRTASGMLYGLSRKPRH